LNCSIGRVVTIMPGMSSPTPSGPMTRSTGEPHPRDTRSAITASRVVVCTAWPMTHLSPSKVSQVH
jgi:hypothetical protein